MAAGLLTEKGTAAFDRVAASHVGDDKVPGLVALVARGEEVHVAERGSLTIGGPPVRRDSVFRISSTTKPITGAVALVLADEGRLHLDEPVDRLVPELAGRRVLVRMDGPLDDTVPARRPITVRDLLTFTFGFGMAVEMFMAPEPWPIVAAADDRGLSTLGPPDPSVPPDPDTWIERLGSLPLLAQPGDRWLYNTGAGVLGVVLARAAGQPLEEVFRTRLFEPLAMSDTAFWTAETGRLTTAYSSGPGGLAVWDPPEGKWSRRPDFPDGAAGLVSTADDLLAFGRMLLRGGAPVLRADAVRSMSTNQVSPAQLEGSAAILDGRGWGFCQAVAIEGSRTAAFGWDGGLGTSWLVDPVRDLIVIVMTQRMFETALLTDVHRDLQEAAYAAMS